MPYPTTHTIIHCNYDSPPISTKHSIGTYGSANVDFNCGELALSFFFDDPREMEQFAATLLTASGSLRAWNASCDSHAADGVPLIAPATLLSEKAS